jgi:sporulation protein YlmC with PRC-barrel domain
MKKITIMSAMIFALGLIPATLHAGWVGGTKGSSPMAGEYKSTKPEVSALEHQARRIIGTYVQDNQGDYLGRITDLMIAPQNGGIAFAILSRGGALGIPMRFAAVPFSAFTFIKEKDVYLLDVSREKMAEAPIFNRGHWPNVTNREWETETYRYYGQTPKWGESNEPMANPVAHNWGKAYDFKKIVGMPVKNQQGEELGKIRDLVIDSQGHAPVAVLSHGGFWGFDEKPVAVPFSDLRFNQKGKELLLSSTKEKLDSAPSFQASDLSNEKWLEDVYQFFGQHPSWMG